jgi:type VI secretion system protein ImpF
MAELTPKERLQPSLLDRLTDNEPERQVESRDLRVLSPQRLRESVRRDLTWLFNSVNLGVVKDLSSLPEVERSTLNYGLPDISGKPASSVNSQALEKLIRKAIWEFEPRLVKQSVRVKLVQDKQSFGPNALCVLIEAELWAQPLPLRLFLRTDLNLETGEVAVSDVTGNVG